MKLRSKVQLFAESMERELRRNDYKGGWEKEELRYLLARLEDEFDELRQAIDKNRTKAFVQREAADVANFAMMVADVYEKEEP